MLIKNKEKILSLLITLSLFSCTRDQSNSFEQRFKDGVKSSIKEMFESLLTYAFFLSLILIILAAIIGIAFVVNRKVGEAVILGFVMFFLLSFINLITFASSEPIAIIMIIFASIISIPIFYFIQKGVP